MKKLSYFLVLLILNSCISDRESRKKIVFESINDFYKNQKEWNNLTQKIIEDETVNHKLGLLLSPDDLHKSIAAELKEREIKYITVRNSLECKEVEYQKVWQNSIGTQFLTWTTCDTLKTKKNFYQSDSSFVEVFGIGNKWLTWIDYDPI